MATLMLGTVFEETKYKYQLKILAGNEGLHRSLRWLYFSEDISNAEFLRGGELMVLTGYGLQGEESLSHFLRMLISRNCCGVIINVGKYIFEEKIPQEILDLCNEHQFPLITMPWKFHLTDIIQEYSQQIFSRTHEQARINDIFQRLLLDCKLCSDEDRAKLLAHHFDPDGTYCVARFIWQAKGEQRPPSTLERDLHVLTENHLNQAGTLCCGFVYQDQLILVFHGLSEGMVEEQVGQIVQLCEASFPNVKILCGVGSSLVGITQLCESYARAGLSLLCALAGKGNGQSFSRLGIYQLFYTCHDARVLSQFTEVLRPLETYDTQYGSQLVETLRLYLRFSGRVNQVADEMYCHRNTTNYRIKKIKSLLGMDLDERETIFKLQMAFYLKEYQSLLP